MLWCYVKKFSCLLCFFLTIRKPFFSCTRIRNSTVYDNGLRLSFLIYNISIPKNRSCFHNILCKCSCTNRFLFRINHCHIFICLSCLNPGTKTCCFISLCGSNATFYHSHNNLQLQNIFTLYVYLVKIKIIVYGNTGGIKSPSVSGRPNNKFIFCTACPAAPFTRLSIAPIIMTRCVLSSNFTLTST